MQSKNTAYLGRLDHLRALAALCVVLFEFRGYMRQLPLPRFPLALIEHGQVGVTLFMVISGFILSHIVGDADLDVPKFYLNRILRIYPLFIFIVALGYFVTPDPRETQTGIDFLLALLPISNLYRLHYGAYGGMMWSIAVELQFYLIFPFFWQLLRIRGASVGLGLIAFMIGTRTLAYLSAGAAYSFGYFSLFGSIDAFVIGCLAQLAFARLPKQLPIWIPVLALVAIVAIAHGELRSSLTGPSWIVWPTLLSASFGVLLVGYLKAPYGIVGGRFAAFVGRVSFSMYVWQYVVFEAIGRFLPVGGWVDTYVLDLLVAFAAVLPVAIASYYVVERPFLELRVQYLKPKPESV
ncbi:acyltransferase family protein [Bradyrhizobium sp.]|uniref:acyltransferase family protein n=1 Tax=Bradyrhizobium sp. TaxID=376 RepID=UPI003C5FCD0F